VRSYEKRLIAFHMHIPGRWRQESLDAGLLGERSGFVEVGRGYRGHGVRGHQTLWGVKGMG
jgi:hypothetical protein